MNNDFNVQFDTAQTMNVEFKEDSFSVDFGPGIPIGDYEGPYEVTPAAEAQVLPTRNKTLDGDITIKPIPNNYGLIIWDGSVITVS